LKYVSDRTLVGLKADGTVVAEGNDKGPFNVSGWRDIVAISAGNHHTIGLKADGTVVKTGGYEYPNIGWCDVSNWRDIGPVPEERRMRMKQGLCIYCGGQLGGLFTKKCKSCGKQN
jgi:alpha-tubulin suppressor-like RCC1 family protein